ncbi:Eco57I restriction-modification methylase domain-containing protein [Pedobacter aquatilis]|uniref:Eco57I restriction-modification methylase domain-containing protein n=1 Tax=Pedobacter aquatilis TaxID=351343 RepID=UPI0029306447|nr:N-6 DNA methylase [Pedobacter aquatilis]
MDKLLSLFSSVLVKYLGHVFTGHDQVNPLELNKKRFEVRGLFICYIIFLKFEPDGLKTKSIGEWLEEKIGKDTLFTKIYTESSDRLREIIESSVCELKDLNGVDPAFVYELMLGVESSNENSDISSIKSNNYRNKLGSYYTPVKLAEETTKKAIEIYTENLVSNGKSDPKKAILDCCDLKFVDFSCGGGAFLVQSLQILRRKMQSAGIDAEEIHLNLLKAAENIYGIDVDCIALELAKFNIISDLNDIDLYRVISNNFTHANFLLHTDSEFSSEEKIETFASGFVYHEVLGLQADKLLKYDVILGNPPWEKIRFEEKKFYGLYSSLVSKDHFKANRTAGIEKLASEMSGLASFANAFNSEIEKAKKSIKKSSFFSLSSVGELNTYALFAEAAVKLKANNGIIALILKSGIITSQVNKKLFGSWSEGYKIIAAYDFINRKKIFQIDSRERFCVLILGDNKRKKFSLRMNMTEPIQISEMGHEVLVDNSDLKLINPLTKMVPNFSNNEELHFLLRMATDFPHFLEVFGNAKFGRIVHFTAHADFIVKDYYKDYLPIYEGKFFHQFDGQYSGFNDMPAELKYNAKSSSRVLTDLEKAQGVNPYARFFIEKDKWLQLSKNHAGPCMLAWRSLTSATNNRTCIATVLPFIPASQSVQFLTGEVNDLIYLCGLFNSVTFDYILKKKLSGIDLTQSVINQMPVPGQEVIHNCIMFLGQEAHLVVHIRAIVLELLKSDKRLAVLVDTISEVNYSGYKDISFLIKLLDLLFMYAYKLTSIEVELVLSSFEKIYGKEDLNWFIENLNGLNLDKAISSTSTNSTHCTP